MQTNRAFWVTVTVVGILVLALWGLTPIAVTSLYPDQMDKSGQFGDLFGTINALFSGLAFAGIIAAIWLQRQELQLQREELVSTRQELQRTADASESQLATTRILQRAYVTVEPGGVHPLEGETTFSTPLVEIVNSGNLPAYDVAWAITFEFDPDGDRVHFEAPLAEGRVILAPKARMIQAGGAIRFPEEVSTREFRWAAPIFLFVWGRVSYTDGFGVTRVTDFCHRYNCLTARKVAGSPSYSMVQVMARHHGHGNRAD